MGRFEGYKIMKTRTKEILYAVMLGIASIVFITGISVASVTIKAAPLPKDPSGVPTLYIHVPANFESEDTNAWERIIQRIRYSRVKVIQIYGDGNGGFVSDAYAVVTALLHVEYRYKEKVVNHISDGAYSAHALLACAANDIELDNNALLMFHDVAISMGTYRDYNVPQEDRDMFNSMFRTCLDRGYLTQGDYDNVYKHYQVYKIKKDGQIVTKLRRDN